MHLERRYSTTHIPHLTHSSHLLLLLNMIQLKSMELHGWVEEVTGPNNSLVFIYLQCPSGSLNFIAAIISKQPVEKENAILKARIKGRGKPHQMVNCIV